MDTLELNERLDLLEKDFESGHPDAREQIKSWREQTAELSAMIAYRDLDMTKVIVKRMRGVITSINSRLTRERDITERERDRLFMMKDAIAYFLSIVDKDFEAQIKSILQQVNENLQS